MINTGSSAINWLVEGLIKAWAAVEDRLWPRGRLLLVRTEYGYALQRPDSQAGCGSKGRHRKSPPKRRH